MTLSKWYDFFNQKGELSKKLPKTITKALGPPAIEIADGITNKLAEIDAKRQVLIPKVSAADSEIDSAHRSIESFRRQIDAIKERGKDIVKVDEESHRLIKQIREKSAEKSEVITSLHSLITKLTARIDQLTSNGLSSDEKSEAITTLHERIADLHIRIDKLMAEREVYIRRLDTATEVIKELEEEREASKEQLEGLELQVGAARQRIEELEVPNESTRLELQELEGEREALEGEREVIEERLSLKDRIKQIIKRYGVSVTGVALAVGVTIGVVLSSLQSGLASVAKGVGSALKSLGGKLANMLPGMIGAIASFIFKTAGEVVSFLGKHAWLLVVGVVVIMVGQLKKKLK